MKKYWFFFIIFGIFSLTARTQTVTAIATTNGIAPIPAFTLNKPAALVYMNTSLGKDWEFDPDVTFDLSNGNGWFMDIWNKKNFHLDTAGKFTLTVGADWSLFFQSYKDGKRVTQSVPYPTFEGKMRFVPDKKNSCTFDWWYTFATQKEFGVKGNYVSLMYTRSQEYKKITLLGDVNEFYINYSDGSRGLGASYDASIIHNRSGLFLGGQIVHSVSPTSSTNIKFGWSVSVGITRKLK
ncbi:MAG TPA: hypothetical protein VG982_01700 [Candidatus Paceibacterota bacterium]|nr:hypothetical protein [Candidatus Paceibacterota bacterium]